jgi:hypothetical protein
MRLKRPSPAMAVAVVALVLAAGGFAVAAIPAADGTIHGCYKKDGGALRVVKGAGGCRAGERALSWNRGVAKVTVRRGIVRIKKTCYPFPPSNYQCTGTGTNSVRCVGAERATGGGYDADTQTTVRGSKPSPDSGKPTGWTITAFASSFGSQPSAPDTVVPIYAVCNN